MAISVASILISAFVLTIALSNEDARKIMYKNRARLIILAIFGILIGAAPFLWLIYQACQSPLTYTF